jgi:hypothetical protein
MQEKCLQEKNDMVIIKQKVSIYKIYMQNLTKEKGITTNSVNPLISLVGASGFEPPAL